MVRPTRKWQARSSVPLSFASWRLRILDARHLNTPACIGDGYRAAAILTQPNIIGFPLVGKCRIGCLELCFDDQQFALVEVAECGFTGRIGAFPDHFRLSCNPSGLYSLLAEVGVNEQEFKQGMLPFSAAKCNGSR